GTIRGNRPISKHLIVLPALCVDVSCQSPPICRGRYRDFASAAINAAYGCRRVLVQRQVARRPFPIPYATRPWQCLNFLPLPQGQGSFRPTVATLGRAVGSMNSTSSSPFSSPLGRVRPRFSLRGTGPELGRAIGAVRSGWEIPIGIVARNCS